MSAEAELQGSRYGGQQFVVLPGLGDEVRGSLLDSLHSFLRITVGGDEDDHCLRVKFQYLLQPGKAFASADSVAAEVHVQQDDVVANARQQGQHLARIVEGSHLFGQRAQQHFQGEEDVFVVVYDEYFSFFHGALFFITRLHG